MNFFATFWKRVTPEVRDAHKLLTELASLRVQSTFKTEQDAHDFCVQLIVDALNAVDESLGNTLVLPVFDFVRHLLGQEAFLCSADLETDFETCTISEGVELRRIMREYIHILRNEKRYLTLWREAVTRILVAIFKACPAEAFDDVEEDGTQSHVSAFAPTVPLYDVMTDMASVLDVCINTVSDDAVFKIGMFSRLQQQLDCRLAIASGVPVEKRLTSEKSPKYPSQSKLQGFELVDAYCGNTLLSNILLTQLPYTIPEAVRFEHTHVLAGTGHGKTQALQHLIANDLERAITDRVSLVVLDSHGDMLTTLMRTAYFKEGKLRDKLIYIDPSELVRPVGLNLFEAKDDAGLTPAQREAYVTQSLELYEYFFDALLGAELTQRQGLIFRYLGLLLTRIPNATIHTLRDVLEHGEAYRPYMATLSGSARIFFETRFFDRTFTETKKQLLTRLWGVLAHPALDRLFSATHTTIDLDKELKRGAVILVNTSVDHLGVEGSAMYSRLIMALIGQSLFRRSKEKAHLRTPTYIYIDEAEPVIDTTFLRLLTAIRKYKGALTFAHQHLDQLEPSIRAGVIANTSVKLAGGVAHKDALVLAPDMRTTSDFIESQRKTKRTTSFAFYAKHITPHALSLPIALGQVERVEKLSEVQYQALLDTSKEKYGFAYEAAEYVAPLEKEKVHTEKQAAKTVEVAIPIFDIPKPEKTEAVTPKRSTETVLPPNYADAGGGGVKHKYLEHVLKELGQARNFRVSLEEVTPDGSGRVDVVLIREHLHIAFEISVTTARDHELRNVEKCLALPFTHVVLLTSNDKRRKSLQTYITDALDDKDKSRVSYLVPEELPNFLDCLHTGEVERVRTVNGITVRTKVREATSIEALARRHAIAKVMAKALAT